MKKLLLIFLMTIAFTTTAFAEIPEQSQKYSKEAQIEYYKNKIKDFREDERYKKTFVPVFVSKYKFDDLGKIWPFIVDMGIVIAKKDSHDYIIVSFTKDGIFKEKKYCFPHGTYEYIRNKKSMVDFNKYVSNKVEQILDGMDI